MREFAVFLNEAEKLVFSRTLPEVTWKNAARSLQAVDAALRAGEVIHDPAPPRRVVQTIPPHPARPRGEPVRETVSFYGYGY